MLIQRYAPLEFRLFVGRRLAEYVKSVGHVGVKSVPRSLLAITSCTGRLLAATGPVGPLRDRLYLTQRAIRCALSETGSLPYIHTHTHTHAIHMPYTYTLKAYRSQIRIKNETSEWRGEGRGWRLAGIHSWEIQNFYDREGDGICADESPRIYHVYYLIIRVPWILDRN